MKARLDVKVTIFLFLLITMATIPTNGNNSTTNYFSGLNWNREYYICGKKLLKAVSHICRSEPYRGISKDFQSLIRQYKNTCCSYPCSLNSLKVFCDDNRNSGAILY